LAGALHLAADAVKMLSKEDIIPARSHRFYYLLAPVLTIMVPLTTVGIMPFFDDIKLPNGTLIAGQSINVDPGILWFFAIVSLTVYGVIFAGWASFNKYSLLGAMRASAAVLSYEIPMGLAAISMVMTYGTVSLPEMIQAQGGAWFGVIPKWGVFIQPLAALIFVVCAFAETNRVPFDLAESESELVAGYHTEYSAMKFGMFFLGEYAAMIVSSSLIITMFFGGWQVPWLDTAFLIKHAQISLQWALGAGFGIALLLTVALLHNFSVSYGRWKDIRDYESAILAFLVIGGGATALLLMFVVMALGLPDWGPVVFAGVAQFHAFFIKLLLVCWVFVWVRWTLPRFRYDQVMNLGWKSLLPLALANIAVTGLVITVFHV
jgi:NADH-quinone oxidoreductase subunit H